MTGAPLPPDREPSCGAPETVAPGVLRVVAANPSPMTHTGTASYLVGAREVAGDARRERKRAKPGGEGKEAEGARDSHEFGTLAESAPPVIGLRAAGYQSAATKSVP